MISFKKSLVAVCAMFAASAYALPQWSPGQVNSIGFNSYENQYRLTASCASNQCLAHTASDPAGWSRVDPTLAFNVRVGDTFAGVLQVYQLQPSGWGGTGADQFTGYFAHVVTNVDTTTYGATNAVIQIGAVASSAQDPFGILGGGELFKLYTDTTTPMAVTGVTAAQSIASVTDGTYWGSLGFTAGETYAYVVDNLTLSGASSFVSKSELALDVIATGPSYNLYPIAKGNDPSEDLQGGVSQGNLSPGVDNVTCTPADLVNANVTCSDFVGNADVKKNTLANSPWHYLVNDPLSVSLLPEPGSLALVGLSLIGLGLARRRTTR